MQFTAWPEMLAWPYLLLKGFLPYQDIAIAHNPLLIFVLAIFYKVFGVGIIQLQIFTTILICITIVLLYWVIKSLYTKKVALFSLLTYILLLFTYSGWGLWFDLALTPFAILLFYAVKKEKWLMAGVMIALGFLTKQTFVYFLIPLLLNKVNLKKFVLGVVPVFGVFTLYLFTFNLVLDYWHWAIQFGIFYLPHANGQVLLPSLKQFVVAVFPFLVFIGNLKFDIWLFAFAGAMGVYPRFELFHFQPALPFLAIVIATSLESNKLKIKYLAIAILIILIGLLGRKIYSERNLPTRFYESDVQKVVSQLTTHYSSPTTLYVVNYWDNIYALTNTTPPKPLIPYIPWYLSYENNSQLIINNLQLKLPEAIVVKERKNLKRQELQTFIDRYYKCSIVEKEVEVCFKNQ